MLLSASAFLMANLCLMANLNLSTDSIDEGCDENSIAFAWKTDAIHKEATFDFDTKAIDQNQIAQVSEKAIAISDVSPTVEKPVVLDLSKLKLDAIDNRVAEFEKKLTAIAQRLDVLESRCKCGVSMASTSTPAMANNAIIENPVFRFEQPVRVSRPTRFMRQCVNGRCVLIPY